MPIFYHDGIPFNFTDDDNGGVPFVFLHGLGGSTEQTLGLFKETKNIRRISIDFRGHGKTVEFGNAEKFNFNTFADDVYHLINHLGLKKVIIGGISTGAGVSLNFALRYPKYVKKLILSRPAWLANSQKPEIIEAFETINKILNDDQIKDKKQAFHKTQIYKHMNGLARYAGNTLMGQFDYEFAKYTSDKLINIPNDAPNWDKEEWRKINVPTLILISKKDPIHPYEYGLVFKEYILNSQLKEITPKEVSGVKHDFDSYRFIKEFLENID